MPNSLTPEQRRTLGLVAAHSSWSRTADRAARTANARRAFRDRFEREVDPDGVLPPAEREARVEHALKAHMARLALKSSLSRSKAARARRDAEALDAEADTAAAALAALDGPVA